MREYAAQLKQENHEPPTPQAEPEKPQAQGTLARRQQEEKDAQDRAREVYRKHQEAVKRTEQIRTAILKGITAGESMTRLFLLATEGLSLATGDTMLHTQAAADVRAIYGHGLQDAGAREIEAAEIRQRLERLKAAERAATDGADRNRIARAIRRHGELLQQIAE